MCERCQGPARSSDLSRKTENPTSYVMSPGFSALATNSKTLRSLSSSHHERASPPVRGLSRSPVLEGHSVQQGGAPVPPHRQINQVDTSCWTGPSWPQPREGTSIQATLCAPPSCWLTVRTRGRGRAGWTNCSPCGSATLTLRRPPPPGLAGRGESMTESLVGTFRGYVSHLLMFSRQELGNPGHPRLQEKLGHTV